MTSVEIITLIMAASPVVKALMGILLLLSLVGWAIIFAQAARLGRASSDDEHFEAWFWSNDNFSKKFNELSADSERKDIADIFVVGYQEFLLLQRLKAQPVLSEALERKLKSTLGRQQALLERGLPTLASIASVAPYIGLLGTVWGIMSAFLGLAQAEQVGLSTIAPSIAEALIATAMGLLAAIPASLGFNHFSAKAAALYERRVLFCDELISTLLRQYFTHAHHSQHQTTPSP